MLNFRTQSRLANLIQAIAEGEKKTEVVRQVLAEQKLFEPHTAFRRLDVNRDSYLTASELTDFLAENKVIVSTREALALFDILDINRDGLISYNEFMASILPREDKKLKTLCTLRESYYLQPGEPLPYEVEWGLTRVLEQEIKNFRNGENLREILQNSYDFTIMEAFNTIDQEGRGFLDFENIDLFMRSCNKVLSDDEILAFIRIAGTPEIGRIAYSQFANIVSPGKRTTLNQSSISTSFHPSSSATKPFYSRKQYDFSSVYTTPKRTQKVSDEDYYDYLRTSSLERSRRILESSPSRQINQMSHSAYNYSTPSKYANKISQPIIKQSPMKGNEEEHLVRTIKQQVNIDRDIEEIKKQLALKVDFNLLDAFRIFDNKGRGYINKLELELSLNDLGLFPSKDEIYLLFKRMDKDNDGLLRYSEFCKSMLPQSSEYASIMNNRNPRYSSQDDEAFPFEYDTKRIFIKLLNKLLEGEIDAEALRQQLNRRPLFSIHDAFTAIDHDENGFITMNEFQRMLNDYGFFVSQTDLTGLINRYDKNQDGKVSYGEFLNEMTPKSPVKY